ncbi:MAG TPA: HAD family hydrolase [Nitrospiria bacterium]|nr:HAD family hydrolase [Nitrospiria bacterium]
MSEPKRSKDVRPSVASGKSPVSVILDLDYTLVPRTSVERIFIRFLWNRGWLRLPDFLRTIRSLLIDSRGPLTIRLKTNKCYLAGRSVRAMEELAGAFVLDEIRPVVSPKALAVLEDHRRQGHRLLLLTGCPEFLIRPLADKLGIDSVIGSRLEERGGRWTGRLIPPHPYGEAKRRLLETWAEMETVRLDQSHAYADSSADVPIFEAVGYPHVVNPGRSMKRLAAVRGWPVLNW